MKLSTLPRQKFKEMQAQTMSRGDILDWIKRTGCLIIGVGMLKGGTGKTTSTLFLALYLSRVLGLNVCVIDTDENSQSMDNWNKARERRSEQVPFKLATYNAKDEDAPDFEDVLERLSEDFDVILVDVGGAGKESYWELCKTAHMLLIPVAPSGWETSRLPASIKTANRGGKQNERNFKVFVTMIKCSNGNKLAAEQRPAVEAMISAMQDQIVIDIVFTSPEFNISSSPDYVRSFETTPKDSHLEEYGALFRHMMKEVSA